MNTQFPPPFDNIPEHRIREMLKDFWAGYNASDGHGYDALSVQAAEEASSLLVEQDRLRDEASGQNVTPGFTRILIGFLSLVCAVATGPEHTFFATLLWAGGLFLLLNGFLAIRKPR